MKRKGFVGAVALAVIVVFALVIARICTAQVPAGYVAVQYSVNGGVKDEVLTQGWHLTSPGIHTTLYSTGLEQSYLTAGKNGDSKEDESFSASSAEGKAMTIDLTFTYQYQPENVTGVFTKFKGQSGKEVRDTFIKPNIVSWTKEVVAQYKISDIIGSERANINIALTEYLARRFEPYGISISNVSLIDVSVDQETRDAINAKITAQQNAETQTINNKTAIEKAEADAQVQKAEAQAEADAKLIRAEAEAQANKLLDESLTSDILYRDYITKWDGKLPTFMSGENGNPNIMIPAGNITE